MDNKAFYKYQESRGQSGYGSAILVKKPSDKKYALLVASQTVPSVFGTQNSFEFDLLNSPVIGKIPGKITLDDKEVSDVLLHRDNVWRLEKLKDTVLDFLYMTPDFVGWSFKGTISFKPNDASADVLTGTYTITPISASDTPIYDCRDLVEETLCFASAIPEHAKEGDTIDVSVLQSATVTYRYFTIDKNGTEGTSTILNDSEGKVTIPTLSASGLIGIKAQATGYAECVTTIYVEKKDT